MHAPPPHFLKNKESKYYICLAFSVINFNDEHINLGSKGSLWVKLEGGIFAFPKLCLKIWL